MQDDVEIVKRFRGKDITAFEELFTKYYSPVFHYLYKMVYSREAAEDIVQDTFVKVYKSLLGLNDGVKLSAWIYRIAYNTCIDYLRKNKRSFELLDNVDYEARGDSNPEARYLGRETGVKIRKVMLSLNSRYRTVLILRDFNGLSYKEIAEVLKESESCIKSLLYRARQEFQRLYGEAEEK